MIAGWASELIRFKQRARNTWLGEGREEETKKANNSERSEDFVPLFGREVSYNVESMHRPRGVTKTVRSRALEMRKSSRESTIDVQ